MDKATGRELGSQGGTALGVGGDQDAARGASRDQQCRPGHLCCPYTEALDDYHIQDWCARCGRVGEAIRVRWMTGESLHDVHEPTFPSGMPLGTNQYKPEVEICAKCDFPVAPRLGGDGLHCHMHTRLARQAEAEVFSAEPVGTRAGQHLRHVADIVDGARNRTHGQKERSFTGIAKAWNRCFEEKLVTPFTASDVARAMVCLKEQRAIYGEQSPETMREHVEDLIGYWAIYLELKAVEG
jgi:hypothetical protein